MIINIFVRRSKTNPALVDIKTSLQREERDTPRISNLCMKINNELQKMICGNDSKVVTK